jgi:hypothetical protein
MSPTIRPAAGPFSGRLLCPKWMDVVAVGVLAGGSVLLY